MAEIQEGLPLIKQVIVAKAEYKPPTRQIENIWGEVRFGKNTLYVGTRNELRPETQAVKTQNETYHQPLLVTDKTSDINPDALEAHTSILATDHIVQLPERLTKVDITWIDEGGMSFGRHNNGSGEVPHVKMFTHDTAIPSDTDTSAGREQTQEIALKDFLKLFNGSSATIVELKDRSSHNVKNHIGLLITDPEDQTNAQLVFFKNDTRDVQLVKDNPIDSESVATAALKRLSIDIVNGNRQMNATLKRLWESNTYQESTPFEQQLMQMQLIARMHEPSGALTDGQKQINRRSVQPLFYSEVHTGSSDSDLPEISESMPPICAQIRNQAELALNAITRKEYAKAKKFIESFDEIGFTSNERDHIFPVPDGYWLENYDTRPDKTLMSIQEYALDAASLLRTGILEGAIEHNDFNAMKLALDIDTPTRKTDIRTKTVTQFLKNLDAKYNRLMVTEPDKNTLRQEQIKYRDFLNELIEAHGDMLKQRDTEFRFISTPPHGFSFPKSQDGHYTLLHVVQALRDAQSLSIAHAPERTEAVPTPTEAPLSTTELFKRVQDYAIQVTFAIKNGDIQGAINYQSLLDDLALSQRDNFDSLPAALKGQLLIADGDFIGRRNLPQDLSINDICLSEAAASRQGLAAHILRETNDAHLIGDRLSDLLHLEDPGKWHLSGPRTKELLLINLQNRILSEKNPKVLQSIFKVFDIHATNHDRAFLDFMGNETNGHHIQFTLPNIAYSEDFIGKHSFYFPTVKPQTETRLDYDIATRLIFDILKDRIAYSNSNIFARRRFKKIT